MFAQLRSFLDHNLVCNLSVKCKIIVRNKRRMYTKSVTVDNMNEKMIKLEYAVRGPVAMRCLEIESELNKGVTKSFPRVTKAHVGEPQAMGQLPITFFRQVIACILHPPLIQSIDFPLDVKERAKEILSHCCGGSIGAYSNPLGIELIRKRCAKYIQQRDGILADWENVWLTAGASTGIRNVLKLFINELNGKPSSIMIPIPQYPLYSATLTEYGIEQVHYYLDEDENWALNIEELEKSIERARGTTAVRAIVVINPGNPTGQVLTRKNIEEIIKFAHRHNLVILADEVYQDNIYADGCQFFSFKKVLTELGQPYSYVELVSFMSCSKGYVGECGFRGGYMEMVNMDPEVLRHFYKICCCNCPTTLGQACMDLVAQPPQPGDESYELFSRERRDILESLRQRADLATRAFNQMDGFTCNIVQGAMYAFPKISLPAKAIQKAKEENKEPDVYYSFKLLEETGICVVPGSGFGQKFGTYHFRTTILPQPERLKAMMKSFKKFHDKFTKEHS